MGKFADMIMAGHWLVLDTETTGLLPDGEVCQLGMIDCMGNTLINRLIKPTMPIPPDATEIHGITNEMVADANTYYEIELWLRNTIEGHDLIIYNANFDLQILANSHSKYDLPGFHTCFKPKSVHCAMLWYADIWGDWSSYHQNNRWQRLGQACHQQRVPLGALHGALADAQATRNLILKVMSKNGYDISRFNP